MIAVRDVATDFITSSFGVSKRFCETAWELVSRNYDSIVLQPPRERDLERLGRPLGIAGPEKSEAVRAIVIFVGAEKQLELGLTGAEFLDTVKGLCEQYEANKRLTQEILERLKIIVNAKPEAGRLDRSGDGEGVAYARTWSNDTGIEGKPLSLREKETIVAECEAGRQEHEIVIVADETATLVFVKGRKVKAPPGKKAYKILSYVLKHKGHGGTAWNIALRVYDDDRAADLEEGKAQAATGRTSDIVNSLSRLVSRRIADVNGYLREWNTELKADDQLHEYSLTRVPSYCLIENTGQRR